MSFFEYFFELIYHFFEQFIFFEHFFERIYCVWVLFWEKLLFWVLFWELFWDFRDDKTFMWLWQCWEKKSAKEIQTNFRFWPPFLVFAAFFYFIVFCVCIKRRVFSFCCYTYIATTSKYKVNRYEYMDASIAMHLSIYTYWSTRQTALH